MMPDPEVPPGDRKSRYVNLYQAAFQVAADTHKDGLTYVEVGVFDGTRTVNLARYWEALTGGLPFHYIGFDLFDAVDPARDAHEILKSKPSLTMAAVSKKLSESGLFDSVELVQGNTRDTLPRWATSRAPHIQLMFLDGGHSLETVESDWAALELLVRSDTIVLFDDYMPDRTDAGAKPLVDRLAADPRYLVDLTVPVDHYPERGITTRIAQVRRSPL